MTTETYKTHSPEETEAVGRKFAEKLLSEGAVRALIALYGDLGVGKTAFVRGFSSALGIRAVKSPTYTVVNEYGNGLRPVFHFDLYRITDEDDLYSVGFDDYLAKEAFCLVEWSENAGDALPDDCIRVTIRKTDDKDGREITVFSPERNNT